MQRANEATSNQTIAACGTTTPRRFDARGRAYHMSGERPQGAGGLIQQSIKTTGLRAGPSRGAIFLGLVFPQRRGHRGDQTFEVAFGDGAEIEAESVVADAGDYRHVGAAK